MKLPSVKSATIFCLLGASQAFRVFAGDESSAGNETGTGGGIGEIAFFIFAGSCLLVAATLMLSQINSIISLLKTNKILVIFFGYALMSCAWALDPFKSFLQVGLIIASTLFGFFIAISFSSKEVLGILSKVMVIIVVSSFLFAVLIPSIGTSSEGWRGVFTNKNVFSDFMNISFITLVSASLFFTKRRLVMAGLAVLSAIMVFLSQSGTGIIVFIIIIAAILWLPYMRSIPSFITGALAAIFLFSSVCLITGWVPNPDVALELLHKNKTITGRTDTWEATYQWMTRASYGRLLFGHGGQEVYVDERSGRITSETVTGSDGMPIAWWPDNTYISLSLKYGIIGDIIFLCIAVKVCANSIRQLRSTSPMRYWYILFAISTLFFFITQNLDHWPFIWAITALILGTPYMRNHGPEPDNA